MSEKSVAPTSEFPTEGELIHAAHYVATARFVGGKEADVTEALSVFRQEKDARDQNPGEGQIRIRKFEAACMLYEQKKVNAQKKQNPTEAAKMQIKGNTFGFAKNVDRSIDLLNAELESREPSDVLGDEVPIPSLVEIGLADKAIIPKPDFDQPAFPEEAPTKEQRQRASWFLSKLSSAITPGHELIIKTPEELEELYTNYLSEEAESNAKFTLTNLLGAVKRQIAWLAVQSEFIEINEQGDSKVYRDIQSLVEQAIAKTEGKK